MLRSRSAEARHTNAQREERGSKASLRATYLLRIENGGTPILFREFATRTAPNGRYPEGRGGRGHELDWRPRDDTFARSCQAARVHADQAETIIPNAPVRAWKGCAAGTPRRRPSGQGAGYLMTGPDQPVPAAASAAPSRLRQSVLRQLARRPLALTGLAVIAVTVAGAALAPWLTAYDPNEQLLEGLTLEGAPLPPGGDFLLGTDLLGRDLLTRLLFGARTSLVIGIVANGAALATGTLIGVTAGYFRGWIGSVLMRFTDLMMAFPALLLAICLAAVFQPSLWIVAMVIALVNWVQTARIVYTETSSLAEREFIAAERTIGAGTPRILFRHLLPHLLPTVIVWGTLGISTTVLLEATLSYLGIGVQPPAASWGNIIFENQTWFQTAPWLVFFPGAAILALALAFNLVGDALRDILDPTGQGRR